MNVNGALLWRLLIHNILNSSLLFFFITMARRNGAMQSTAITPHSMFAHGCGIMPARNSLTKVIMINVTVDESTAYIRVFINMWRNNVFQ